MQASDASSKTELKTTKTPRAQRGTKRRDRRFFTKRTQFDLRALCVFVVQTENYETNPLPSPPSPRRGTPTWTRNPEATLDFTKRTHVANPNARTPKSERKKPEHAGTTWEFEVYHDFTKRSHSGGG
jgi:hypothetical protein